MYIEITDRESPCNLRPRGPTTWFWVKDMNYWLHGSFVQSVMSAGSQEELPIPPLSSEVGEEEENEEEGSCIPSLPAGRRRWHSHGLPSSFRFCRCSLYYPTFSYLCLSLKADLLFLKSCLFVVPAFITPSIFFSA